jgi:hypothetical protein
MTSRQIISIGLLAATGWLGCASGAEPTEEATLESKSASSGADQEAGGGVESAAPSAEQASPDGQADAAAGSMGALAWTTPKTARTGVTSMRFSDTGVLWVGFEDATVARLEGGKSSSLQVHEEPQPVAAVSPKGRVALLRSQPGQLVRIDDQKTVLRMNDVKAIESATFSRDGKVFFVAETSGKLHIWRGGDQLYALPDETVQKFMDRQLPDFTAHFDSITGPMAVTKPRRVAVGNSKGEILWWDPRTPNKVEWIARLDSPVRSIGIVGDHIVATSEKGKLGVASRPEQMVVRWSREAEAQWVASAPTWDDRFVEIADGKLGVREVAEGDYKWRVALPAGDVCGLEIAADANQIAICFDDVIALVDLDTQKVLGTLYRSGDTLHDSGF